MPKKDVLKWCGRVIVYGLLFISPWLITHSDKYLQIFSEQTAAAIHVKIPYWDQVINNAINLFSPSPLYYGFGASMAHYTFLILLALLFGFCAKHRQSAKYSADCTNDSLINIGKVNALSVFAFYLISIVFLSPVLFGSNASLRFCCPVIIGAFPVISIFGIGSAKEPESKKETDSSKAAAIFTDNGALGVFSAIVMILCIFFSSLTERIDQAWHYGSVLSFRELPRNKSYLAFNDYALNGAARRKMQAAQHSVPKNSVIVAWTPLAFHLDYQRNKIIHADPAGLCNPWANRFFVPLDGNPDTFFKKIGADYLLWHYNSFASRSKAELLNSLNSYPYLRSRELALKMLYFLDLLNALKTHSDSIYDDGSIAIFKL